jgi:hypothetical protein
MNGVERIAAERQRQIKEEGFDPEHDSQHTDSELAWAACYYAMPCMIVRKDMLAGEDPPRELRIAIMPDYFLDETGWDKEYDRRGGKTRIRQLEIAGALIAEEIDRLLAVERAG